MVTSITIDVDASEVLRRIRSFEADRTLGLMKTLGALVEGQTKRRLAAEKTSPDGKAWPALTPLTVRARKNRSNSPLTDTGRLMDSIGHTAGRTQAIVGTNVEYAAYHQYGVASIKPKGKRALRIPFASGGAAFVRETSIPARPFLGISDRNMVEIRAAVDAWVAENFR